ncbi:hypothetical protein PS639_05862 [Pseudomonas fluorescens]|nr:hypothetical protein PS639_05862 [Pseudomonas fluorescens]
MASLTTKAVEKIVRSGLPGMTNDGDGLYLKLGRTGRASWISATSSLARAEIWDWAGTPK